MDKNYKYYKDHGICPQCGIREAAPGRVRCEICLAKNAESQRRKREHETDAQRKQRLDGMKIYRNIKRKENKNNGRCIYCGKALSAYSSCFCPDCRIKNQRKNEGRKMGKIPRSEWASYGICYHCGKNQVIPGKKLCQSCCEKAIESLKIAQNSSKTIEYRNYIRSQNNLIFGK